MRAPPAGAASAQTRPPWAEAIAWTIARPEAGPAGIARAAPVQAVEAVEDRGALFDRDPGAVVVDDEAQTTAARPGR